MATLELKREAQTPPRIQNTLDTKDYAFNRARRTALVQLMPSVFLLATVKTDLNQCVLELLYSNNSGEPQPAFASSKRLSTGEPLDANDGVRGGSTQRGVPPIPQSLLDQFRTPLVIQVVHQDEGLITCVEFAVDTTTTGAASSAGAAPVPDIAKSGKRNSGSSQQADAGASLNGLYVHLFIGTSHGTVIGCNALRGTILVMAQFQYRPPFLQNSTSDNTEVDKFLEDDVPDYDTPNKSKKITQIFSRAKKENEPVVKFVLHRRPTALQYNPSINMSTSKLSPLVSVYVIHAGGRVVVFNRSVLDVFVQTAEEKLDGRRPSFAVDWSPEESSYPVAGAAAPFASQIQSVYILRKLSRFSSNESVTYKKETAARVVEVRSGAGGVGGSGSDDDTVIRDASYFLFLDDADVTNVLSQNPCTVDALILCGRKPAVSIYPLEPQHEEYSATRSVKAIVSKAKNLWYAALGKHRVEPPKKLEEIPQLASTGMLEGDSTFSTVVVDPSQQCAALFCEEGSGRLYLVDIPTGTIWRVLKGCREAQFQFWMVRLLGKRVLCIAVHLPLRKVIEVHAVRIAQRVAACSVPEGALLLPPTSETSSPVLIDAMGRVHTLTLDTHKIQKDVDAFDAVAVTGETGEQAPRLSQTAYGEFVNAATLRACRTPDVYLNLALCLPLPFAEPLARKATDKKYAEQSKALAVFVAQTTALCAHLKLRFAPSSMDISVLPFDATTMEERLQCGAPPADSLTAAQCLHYVQLRVAAVESYARLARCVAPTSSDIGSLFATEKSRALWDLPLANMLKGKESAALWSSAVQAMLQLAKPCAGSAPSPPSATQYNFDAFWPPPTSDKSGGKVETGVPVDAALAMDLKSFLACFFYGEVHLRFLSDSIKRQEESTDDNESDTRCCTPVFLSLAHLIFEKNGLPSFLSQMEVVSQLGVGAGDLCLLVLFHLAHAATVSMDRFLHETDVGMLSFVLNTFSDETFLGALEYFPLPLLIRAKDARSSPSAPVWQMDPSARPILTCLLLCCTLRLQERDDAVAVAVAADVTATGRQRWRLALGKLLSFWQLSAVGAGVSFQDSTAAPSSPTSRTPVIAPCATSVKLRLKNLNMGADAAAGAAAPPPPTAPSDTLEAVLGRKGLPPGVVQQLQEHLRTDSAEIEKARSYVRLMAIYQPTEGNASPTAEWNTCDFPWLRQGSWYSAHFESFVVQPLEDVWQRQQGDSSLFFQSCIVVLSWNVCHNLVCRNFDNAFLFFPMHTVPTTNFLSRVQSGCSPLEQTERKAAWLAEGRSTRNYLQSMIKLVKLARRTTREMLLGQRDDKTRSTTLLSKGDISDKSQAQRVRLVQAVISGLTADDDLVFPCVPQPLRVCLENMKNVVGSAPLLLLSRLDSLYSFLQLVLLFVDGSAFQIDGKSIVTQVAAVPIHWAALFQQPQSYFSFLDLFCDRASGAAQKRSRDAALFAERDDREVRVIRQRLRASSVLVRDLLDIAIMEDDHVPTKSYLSDASLARLFSKDTASILDKVCQITDVSTYVTDATPLYLFDYQIKHLCPNKAIAKTFASLTNKKQGAVIAVAGLRLLITAVMSYCEGIRKPTTRTTVLREGATYEADDFIGRIYRLLADTRCLQWVKRLEADIKKTAEDLTRTAVDGQLGQAGNRSRSEGPFSAEVIGGYSWVTPREQVDVVKRVHLRLASSTFSSQRTDFAELLFTLAQIGNENPAGLSEETAAFVHDLPRVANGIRTVL